MEKIPQPGIENKEPGRQKQEKTIELGRHALQRELTYFEIAPKRAGAFVLMTLLAMGIFPGEAKSQGRFGPFTKENIQRQTEMEVKKRMSIEMSEIEQRQRGRIQELETERAVRMTQLGDAEGRLDYEFQNGRISRQEYELAKEEVRREKQRIEKEYGNKIRNARMGLGITGRIFQGIRGW